MKKILSFILAITLVFTSVAFAHAEDSNTYKVGDIIQFGSYPQSEVKDEILIAELNALTPEWEEWTSYGYYSGTGQYGTMVQGDWMRYVDVSHNNLKYRGVMFNKYKSNYTWTSWSDYPYSDYYQTNVIYWFRFEPINWRILDPDIGLVISDIIIDTQAYSNTVYWNGEYYNKFNNYNYKLENYACDYKTSTIRKWLNDEFYNLAFDNSEKNEIVFTNLTNNSYFTSNGVAGYSALDSENTSDKIYLLSLDDIKNSRYGFSTIEKEDYSRQTSGSDYAKCQGLYKPHETNSDNSCWLLRTPGISTDKCVSVEHNGTINNYLVYFAANGVRPAFKFKDLTSIHLHRRFSTVTPPTCTTQGYTTYTCECGDKYKADYVKANGHSYTSEVTTPATHLKVGIETLTCHCGDTYTRDVPKLTEHTYTEVVTDPTCTAQGYTTYTCECGNTYDANYINANGHSFTNYISDSTATCVTDGKLIAKCDNCEATDVKPEKGAHKFDVFLFSKYPSCTEDGEMAYFCKWCELKDESSVVKLEKLPHNFKNDWQAITLPTCTNAGVSIRICNNCLITESKIENAKGHSFNGSACTDCGYNRANDCSCNCHKGGISGFFFKILNFFQKLFGTNKICACGAKH